ncbi:protein phosphatase [Natronobacillus azotifigens]|uniref:protein-serine/threonine phosphatase n=1 Tax=Natronobacillus azotifigens TaxID=472978 RepID=A0A9J6RDI1_9BACI|nr:Stp1/IreP family PP2C-type Ser/Thr phosphatase [Natronobacillus azotifigens]MCZ0703380.1 Stp1/IreP family PP2C-type Ser/Thr phosphatase [Natronobacillus azotifigens]
MNQYFLTDQGKVRQHNEDAGGVFRNLDQQELSVVADGMGGHRAGDVASKMVKDYLSQKWEKTKQILSRDDAQTWLKEVVIEANEKVFQYAENNPECSGMGTTVIAVMFASDFVAIAHIGDSRCYRFHNHELLQITDDHSLVNELVRTGQISREDAAFHPRKNVLIKALGTDLSVEPDILIAEWEEKDRLLICSDGLTNKISDKELALYLEKEDCLDIIGQELVSLANERGGEDNITLVLSEYDQKKAGETQ